MTRRSPPCMLNQVGFTLVEIMVALTIGLILLTLLSVVFVVNGVFRQELDRSSRLVENGNYALDQMSADLQMAGYYAEFDLASASLPTPTTKPDACTVDLPSLRAALPIVVQGYDSGTNLPASCATVLQDLKVGSDVLLVRRVDSCEAGPVTGTGCDAPVAGRPYFQASQCTPAPPAAATELASTASTDWFKLDTIQANLTLHQIDCNVNSPGTLANYHRFIEHIYFVANDDNPNDGIPTLKMAQLDGSGSGLGFVVVPVAEGIENLQLEYGLDTQGTGGVGTAPDGIPDTYAADPDTFGGCGGAACMVNWLNTVTVKVHLLARNTEAAAPGAGYVDAKTFNLGLTANGGVNSFGPFNDAFKRHVYAAAVRLYNSGGRREP